MRRITAAFAICAMAILALSACKKDKSRTELLTQKGWRLTDIRSGGVSLFSLIPDCDKDDILTFQTNNSVQVNHGASACSSSDPQIENLGTWSLQNTDAQLVINTASGSDTYTIVILDENALNLTGSSYQYSYSH